MLMEFMEILVSQGASQRASQGRSFLARAFDLARPGVAPPLHACRQFCNINACHNSHHGPMCHIYTTMLFRHGSSPKTHPCSRAVGTAREHG